MVRCIGKNVRVIHIFAPLLTKLFIKALAYYDGSEFEVPAHKIVLDTPAVRYPSLDTDVVSVGGYLVKNQPHLINVNIDIEGPFRMGSHEVVSKAVTDLLMRISGQCSTSSPAGFFMSVNIECQCFIM